MELTYKNFKPGDRVRLWLQGDSDYTWPVSAGKQIDRNKYIDVVVLPPLTNTLDMIVFGANKKDNPLLKSWPSWLRKRADEYLPKEAGDFDGCSWVYDRNPYICECEYLPNDEMIPKTENKTMKLGDCKVGQRVRIYLNAFGHVSFRNSGVNITATVVSQNGTQTHLGFLPSDRQPIGSISSNAKRNEDGFALIDWWSNDLICELADTRMEWKEQSIVGAKRGDKIRIPVDDNNCVVVSQDAAVLAEKAVKWIEATVIGTEGNSMWNIGWIKGEAAPSNARDCDYEGGFIKRFIMNTSMLCQRLIEVPIEETKSLEETKPLPVPKLGDNMSDYVWKMADKVIELERKVSEDKECIVGLQKRVLALEVEQAKPKTEQPEENKREPEDCKEPEVKGDGIPIGLMVATGIATTLSALLNASKETTSIRVATDAVVDATELVIEETVGGTK
jgi:hypothetical protein